MQNNTTDKFKQFNEIDLHIILYAKSWYTETDTMKDLARLLAQWSAVNVSAVRDMDIVNKVSDTMHKVLAISGIQPNDMNFLYQEVWRGNNFNYTTTITMSDMVESFLRVMRYKQNQYYPELPEPNPNYLDVPEDKLERFVNMRTTGIDK